MLKLNLELDNDKKINNLNVAMDKATSSEIFLAVGMLEKAKQKMLSKIKPSAEIGKK